MKLSRQSFITAALLVSSLGFGGCSPAFWGGAAAGVLGAGAGYEVHLNDRWTNWTRT